MNNVINVDFVNKARLKPAPVNEAQSLASLRESLKKQSFRELIHLYDQHEELRMSYGLSYDLAQEGLVLFELLREKAEAMRDPQEVITMQNTMSIEIAHYERLMREGMLA